VNKAQNWKTAGRLLKQIEENEKHQPRESQVSMIPRANFFQSLSS